MKSLFTTYKQGHSFCHPWIYSTALSVKWLSLHVASIESLGDCNVCNKLRVLRVTHYIHNKVLSLQSLVPLHADTCATERKLGMAHKNMQNDRILSFLTLNV